MLKEFLGVLILVPIAEEQYGAIKAPEAENPVLLF